MVKVFFTSQSLLENSTVANSMKTGMDVDAVSVFGNFSGSKINAFPSAVSYCRRMLLLGALEKSEVSFNIDADWERQLDVLFRTVKESRKAMKSYIKSVDEDTLYTYLTATFEGKNIGHPIIFLFGDVSGVVRHVARLSNPNGL